MDYTRRKMRRPRFLRRRADAQSSPVLDPDLAGLTYPNTIEWWLTSGAWAWSPTMSEKVGTVARCMQLVSQQIATLPLRFRTDSPSRDQPLWVHNPDPVWFPGGIGSAIFAAASSMYGWGDAFLWVTSRYFDGFPQTWTVVDPQAIVVEENPGGGRLYRVQASGDYLDPDDVLQISRNPRGTLRGTSALEGYAGNVASALAAESYAADTFSGGGVPWAILQPQRRVTKEQAEELQAQWMNRRGGGVPAVVPPDIAYKEFAFNPKDMALLETREWDAKQIAAAFGVPAFMLNMEQSGGLQYTNPEMLFRTWWNTELYPAAHRVAAHLSTWTPRGSWVEFDPSILLRPDLSTMSQVWLNLLKENVVTVNEVRAAVLDLPPTEEGEALAMIDQPPGAKTNEAQAIAAAAAPPALEVVQ